MIWKKTTTLAELNQLCANCAVGHLGIEFTDQGENYLRATMPVDHRTTQPFGLLHGGVSAVLAETLASASALLCCEENEIPVGTELNISHLKAVKKGRVTGTAKPLHLGKTSQVWQVEISDESDRLCALARVSLHIMKKAL